jgi:hypothetical protein
MSVSSDFPCGEAVSGSGPNAEMWVMLQVFVTTGGIETTSQAPKKFLIPSGLWSRQNCDDFGPQFAV